jgi:hypothetical protein
MHAFYAEQGTAYREHRFRHAFASLLDIGAINKDQFTADTVRELAAEAVATKAWITDRIESDRVKDYENPFRQMVYSTPGEMDKVLGKLSDNGFILQQRKELVSFRKKTARLVRTL